MSDPEEFRVYRPKEGGPDDELAWRVLRRGVADIHRRAQVCQRANERYLDALAGVREGARLGELAAKVTHPVSWKGKVRRWSLGAFKAAMNRDFAYLLVLFAIFDHLDWFLWGTAFGTYLFAVLLVGIYRWPKGG